MLCVCVCGGGCGYVGWLLCVVAVFAIRYFGVCARNYDGWNQLTLNFFFIFSFLLMLLLNWNEWNKQPIIRAGVEEWLKMGSFIGEGSPKNSLLIDVHTMVHVLLAYINILYNRLVWFNTILSPLHCETNFMSLLDWKCKWQQNK